MKFRYIIATLFICLSSLYGFAAAGDFPSDAAAETTYSKRSSDGNKSHGKSSSRITSPSSVAARAGGSKSSSSSNSRPSGSAIAADPNERPTGDSLSNAMTRRLISILHDDENPGALRVNSVNIDNRSKTVKLSLNERFTYLPLDRDLDDDLKDAARDVVPDSIRNYSISLNVGSKSLLSYANEVPKLKAKQLKNPDFVKSVDLYSSPKKGMENDIVAMWHSHGRYFKDGSWAWQRPFLFETAEDVYTMSYVLPYIVPMLENAGAYVMLPRERDINRNEVIVDNDTNEGGEIFSQPYYKESNGSKKWETGDGDGFIYDLKEFRDTENPFENGTYRQVQTQTGGKPSVAAWCADIPEDGEYAVYVSYKTLPNSTTDAHYTVNYSGGSREFRVNQTMGGGTWIYLGTFPFEEGYSETEPVVTLSNLSADGGKIVTADAVKIGGGMGNIARSKSRRDIYYDPSTPIDDAPAVAESDEEGDFDDREGEGDEETVAEVPVPQKPASTAKKGPAPKFSTSGLPRYLEGARYWLHWAGIPESVYSPNHGSNDYKDDYSCRGYWVNYLAGGSRVNPKAKGLNIPVDISMALHSDAGITQSENTSIGTLGIYHTRGGASYPDGTPRNASRYLVDMLMRSIVSDIRETYEPNWNRRPMFDKSYAEANSPEVPAALIEFMSHQNYGDMQYGLDPNFRFLVGRSIYKALARYMAERKGREVVIQPLPVKDFAITRTAKGKYRLSWEPTEDKLEKSAVPDKYYIFERNGGDLGFRKIGETKSRHFDIVVKDNDVHSFRIVAANEGGVSFPSETLAMRESNGKEAPVLIINGFNRVAAPAHSDKGGKAGFYSEDDFGVPYIRDISFTGHQTEFRRSAGQGHGKSNTNYTSQVIAGNTFDFVAEHGMSVSEAGYGFVSCSAGAVENGTVKLGEFKTIDLILGKQKATRIGNGHSGVLYRAFPPALQAKLRAFLNGGGHLIVSGQYVASDLLGDDASEEDRRFADDVLGIELDGTAKSNGKLNAAKGSGIAPSSLTFSNTLNDKLYIVEKPDRISSTKGGKTLLSFSDSSRPAAILNQSGKGKVIIMSVPFETIYGEDTRDALMKSLMKALN